MLGRSSVMDRKGKGRAKGTIALMDLPLETLKAIVGYVPRKDLPSLARVSRELHPLASAEIYRVLDLKLTSRPSVDYNTPSTRVEDTLRTIVTSNHDYAQYIKFFGLSVSEHNTIDPYESHIFLSTILFLVLSKAKILESFRWAASKGLDDSVYHVLHKVPGLQHLHVRLEPVAAGLLEIKAHPLIYPPSHHPPPPPPTHLSSAKLIQKQKTAVLVASHRTFSGFKHLSSLALLDIDHIEYATEIAKCLKGSSGTLKKLSLSFSKSLAMKARKPSAQHHGGDPDEDTETEPDEVDFDGAPNPPTTSGPPPVVSEADIRKERSVQESMLARMFNLEQVPAAKKVDRVLEASAAATASVENPDRVFMQQLKNSMLHLKNSMLKLQGVSKTTGGGESVVALKSAQKVALKSIQKAAEKYLQNMEKNSKKPSNGSAKGPMTGIQSKSKPGPPMPSTQAGFSEFAKFGDSMPSSLVDPYWSNQLSQLSALSSMSGGLPTSATGKLPSGMYNFNSPYAVGEYPYVTGGPSQSPPKPPIYPHSHGSHGSSIHGPFGDVKKPKVLASSSSSLLPIFTGADVDAHTKETKKQEHIEDDKKELEQYFLEHEAEMEQKKGQDIANLMDEASNGEGGDWAKEVDEDSMDSKPSVPSDPKVNQQEDSMGIDIEHPDVIEDDSGDDQEMVDETEVAIEVVTGEANGTLTPSLKQARLGTNGSPTHPISSSSTTTDGLSDAIPAGDVDHTMVDDHVAEVEAPKSTNQTMQEYLHSTHGLPLEEFSLYLIPIKASVIVRAIDLTILKRITLLNVGPQGAFWTLMTRLPSPIRLQSIFTDNVTPAFLACLDTFQGLTELLMLERGTKTEIETFAARTTVGIEDIRRRALKKHIRTLKRLMIKNDEDDAWDADARTVRFLTSKGAKLEELAIGFNLANYHLLMQSLPGLTALTAFRIVAFRSEDSCPWVSNELRKFTVDNLSHCPRLRLRWLGINSHVSEIRRRGPGGREEGEGRGGGEAECGCGE
ncbi:MAG: hypothetical protein FRX48_05907 [Lasallia pustulata]|uniref:F-box domain-containing protein n=1 Tax=Lasallia pustulata TaxID=136370 RepID=A0A5M8PLX7_9LECA|nr:MAG: hypothetical protein FRX48_05907 [Lasallia pustulata]